MVGYADAGLWCTYLGCDAGDVNHCLRLVRTELNRFIEHPLTERQLEAARKQLKGQIGIARDNSESMALDLGKSFLHEGKPRDIESLMHRIDSVTSADIQNVAREVFAPEGMSTLIYE
jgi:M16 family peptidase